MSYRKSDGAFGLLPKKTAMDLEWPAARTPTPRGREVEPSSHRIAEIDIPIPRGDGEIQPWTKTRLT